MPGLAATFLSGIGEVNELSASAYHLDKKVPELRRVTDALKDLALGGDQRSRHGL